ncbi:MAG: aldo/keto reductase [Fusicatenibacter sp.]|nr:aldo/keto reductase [Lachnospiraceae bacterium]MDY2936795.1 aldo/keto reductase [Fusicatenibacter sp.]
MAVNIPKIILNDGNEMPLLGLGVYKVVEENEVEQTIRNAVAAGYRMIDTASVYKNEEGVGRGIRSCGIPREDLFITTKIWNTAQRVGDIEGAFHRSLDRMKLDYVDLYLIHWPVSGCYLQTWKAFEAIAASGRAKSIGVSNFEEPHLTQLFEFSGIYPAVNQIECHPLWVRKALVSYCQEKKIAVQAYAPLARGLYLKREIIQKLAEKYNKTPAQIGLRYLVQRGISVIPKSTHKERIESNADVFSFSLSDLDMALIDSMDEQFRSASIPEDMVGQGVH